MLDNKLLYITINGASKSNVEAIGGIGINTIADSMMEAAEI